jgi:hypothetical protein
MTTQELKLKLEAAKKEFDNPKSTTDSFKLSDRIKTLEEMIAMRKNAEINTNKLWLV